MLPSSQQQQQQQPFESVDRAETEELPTGDGGDAIKAPTRRRGKLPFHTFTAASSLREVVRFMRQNDVEFFEQAPEGWEIEDALVLQLGAAVDHVRTWLRERTEYDKRGNGISSFVVAHAVHEYATGERIAPTVGSVADLRYRDAVHIAAVWENVHTTRTTTKRMRILCKPADDIFAYDVAESDAGAPTQRAHLTHDMIAGCYRAVPQPGGRTDYVADTSALPRAWLARIDEARAASQQYALMGRFSQTTAIAYAALGLRHVCWRHNAAAHAIFAGCNNKSEAFRCLYPPPPVWRPIVQLALKKRDAA